MGHDNPERLRKDGAKEKDQERTDRQPKISRRTLLGATAAIVGSGIAGVILTHDPEAEKSAAGKRDADQRTREAIERENTFTTSAIITDKMIVPGRDGPALDPVMTYMPPTAYRVYVRFVDNEGNQQTTHTDLPRDTWNGFQKGASVSITYLRKRIGKTDYFTIKAIEPENR